MPKRMRERAAHDREAANECDNAPMFLAGILLLISGVFLGWFGY
jgi:hypothetical protein